MDYQAITGDMQKTGKITRPFTKLLDKQGFSRTREAQSAFEALKSCDDQHSGAGCPEFEHQFIVDTDASGKGLGAVLMQGGRLL